MRSYRICLVPFLSLAVMAMLCRAGSWAAESDTAESDTAAVAATSVAATSVAEPLVAEPLVAETAKPTETAEPIGLFEAIKAESVEVQFVAKNDHQASLFVTNKLAQPIDIKMPEAFVGVPVLAQFGGGGGGRRGGGGGGGSQSVGGGGRRGGAFSIPPEQKTEIEMPVLCLEHGKADPSSSKAYEIRPVESLVDRPAVVELLKAFGSGKLQQGAAQAAVWHLNNDLSWDELADKLTGTERSGDRQPYFSPAELQGAVAYARQANQRAEAAAAEAATVNVATGEQLESPGYEQ